MSIGSTNKQYPIGIDTFTIWQDDIDTVIASNVNDVQTQIIAIESTLGINPQGSALTLKDRLATSINDDGTLKQTAIGATGIQGIQGVTGLIGATGIQGLTGIQGQTGIQGITGLVGITGIIGITGLVGITGLQGSQGITGLMGFTGIGAQGQTGVQGIQGATGINGIQGQTGVQGIIGSTGINGVQGNTGIQGQTGISSGDCGTMYIDNATITITIGAANTDYQVTGYTSGVLNNISFSSNNLVVSKTARFIVNWSLCFINSTATARNMIASIYAGPVGTPVRIASSSAQIITSSTSIIYSFSGNSTLSLSANDVVQLRIRNVSNANNITVKNSNVTLTIA